MTQPIGNRNMLSRPRNARSDDIFDEEAECSIIASIILEPSWLDELDLDPDDFFITAMKRIFQAEFAIKQRGDHIDEISVAREISGDVELWVLPKVISELPTHLDCAYYAGIVKELSRKRKLIQMAEDLKKGIADTTSSEMADKIRASLDALTFFSKTSRSVIFSNARIMTSEPPTYLINISSINGRKAVDIRFTSTELDNSTAFKRKIRERLQINPILPKGFDALIHSLVTQAKAQFAPKDASADENVCFWIREWFKTAVEAEHPEDLTQGYLDREGAYWFQATRMLKYLSDKAKIKLTPSSFWPILEGRGGRRSKVHRLGENTARLWGLDKKFFIEEEEEMAEGAQIPMGEKEEDLSWLEE